MLSRLLAEHVSRLNPAEISIFMVAMSINIRHMLHLKRVQLTELQISAGADTTVISLRPILYFLIKNPSKLVQARQEIDKVYEAGLFRNLVSHRQVRQHLPYPNASIKEALRLHPVIGLVLERLVPPGRAEICGRYISGGTVVGINPCVVHYDPEIFLDRESFEPERWLDIHGDTKRLRQMNRSFIPFGSGSRMCMGK